MASVAMQRKVKDGLIKDVATYVAEGRKKWYAAMGIPHRRGYLLYGPPGCGKTSVINAIAGEFELSVCSITLSNPELTDDSLAGLFRSLPDRALVLLEDVDVSGIEARTPVDKSKAQKRSARSKTGVTLSGLLNCIDGANSVEHRQQFAHIFADIPEVITFSTDYDIPKLAEAFAASIPEGRITPAEIQGYLLHHHGCPATAVENAKAWVDALIKVKDSGCNVLTFDGEIGGTAKVTTEEKAALTATPSTAPDLRPQNQTDDQGASSGDATSAEEKHAESSEAEDDQDDETDDSEPPEDDDEEGDKDIQIKRLEARTESLK